MELFTRQGYDATSIDHVAEKAGVSAAEFAEYFATTEAVLMSTVEDMAYGTAAELKSVATGVDPVRALLQAGTAALGAVVEGRGSTSLDRLLAMARTVTSTRNLQRKVSAARKQVLTQPLADWMGVDPNDRRLQHALTMWSAVAASAYVGALGMPNPYELQRNGELRQRMIAGVLQSFSDVMGVDPQPPE
jgi:AcrR family transcriptional regulator